MLTTTPNHGAAQHASQVQRRPTITFIVIALGTVVYGWIWARVVAVPEIAGHTTAANGLVATSAYRYFAQSQAGRRWVPQGRAAAPC